MFDAGAIAFRLQMIGAEVFKRDAKGADEALKALGESSEKTAKKVAPVGTEVDKAGKAAKGAKAPLDQTSTSTKKLGEESEKAAPKVKKTAVEVEKLKHESEAAGRLVGTAAVGIGAAVAAMAAVSVAQFANFDEAMSKTGAATMAGAADQAALGDAALQAGADTVFSATQAADAQTELSKAGQSVSDILGGSLTCSLALAAAGELGVARAAEIAATTLTVFKLKGKDAGHVADLLAAGAGKAQGSVDDLALALEYVGPTFARLNIPLESTVGTLGLLAANGILGEKAGAGLRGVIQSLTAPVAKGGEVMKQYGINVFDASGEFIGMEGAAGQLQKGLGGLDEQTRSAALGAIFGAESANVAGVLFAAGAEGVAKWTENVDDQGFAAEQARIKTDNLNGDIEALGGSMETALIKTGSASNDVLRDMVQILTGLVNGYSELDPAVQGTALVLGIGTAAALLLGGTMLLAVPKIAEFKLALGALNTSMQRTATFGIGIGLAITALVTILAAVGDANADAAARTKAYGDTLDVTTHKITASSREMAKANLAAKDSFLWFESDSTYDAAAKLGIGLDLVTDAATGNVEALKTLRDELDVGEIGSKRYEEAIAKSGLSTSDFALALIAVEKGVKGENESIDEAIRLAKQKQRVDGETVDSNAGVEGSYDKVTEAVDGVTTSVSDLAAELDELNGKSLDAREAARQLEAAYDDFDASLKENGQTLDTTTEKGRANEAALDKIAEAALDAGQAIVDSGGSYADYQASLNSSREALLIRINDLGITGQAAEDLANDILRIPSETDFAVYANTQAAEERLRRIQNLINGIGRTSQLHISTGVGGQGGMTQADGGVVSYYANGGVREHHVAQIERAGAMRVWAEPETGGEAYIPLSPAKRGRSSAILAEVAQQFGYQLMPAGAQQFGNGGRTPGQTGSSPAASRTPEIVQLVLKDGRVLAEVLRDHDRSLE